ncbi:MAG: hypothetical protein L0Y74_06910 [candidate division Zixibacteria bacterium]|nr:hypothetical protein [candidate division Zixibacteria bacterium]
MSDNIKKAKYYKTFIPNQAGQGAKLLAGLKGKGVNLLAFSGFPAGGKSQLDFIPEKPSAFERAVKKAGVKFGGSRPCFVIQGKDKPGAMARIMQKLAKANVSVTALDGVAAGKKRYGAILWVKPKDYSRASRALGAR